MGVLDLMAKAANYIPTVEKPKQKPGLYERLLWTALALVVYMIMANTPLYGIETQGPQNILLVEIIFASNRGTLMELGIGPIVTAGLIMQILVGAKLIDLDMSNPEDRKKFTAAQKTFALMLGAFEAAMYVAACRYWQPTGPNIFFDCSGTLQQRVLVGVQLFLATYIVILLDEMIQKGWGLGSGVSLFILAGVSLRMFWYLLSNIPIDPANPTSPPIGFVPYLWYVYQNSLDWSAILARRIGGDLIGLITTLAILFLLVYLQGMKVEIPVTSPRLRSIKTKVPLQFLYVSNIPVLLVGILYSDILVFASIFRTYLKDTVPSYITDFLAKYENGHLVGGLAYYLSPPGSFVNTLADPVHAVVYAVSVIVLAVIFGLMWVEISGLSASAQAEQLIKSGMEIPGVRRNPKMLEAILSRYITPLTILSAMIAGAIAVTADLLGAYGTGMGILLAIGIVQQYYMLIAYERALEAYPLLKRLMGK